MVNALVIGADEGRSKPAIVFGEEQTSLDPEISEWGNPVECNVPLPLSEYIGHRSQTQGSETSQYLKEKKSKEIPQVVASERGRA